MAVGKVTADFRLVDVAVLDEPQFRPHVITENFWRGWEKYRRPTLVSFNGRRFDLPLLELAAFRYGVSVPGWFNVTARDCTSHVGGCVDSARGDPRCVRVTPPRLGR